MRRKKKVLFRNSASQQSNFFIFFLCTIFLGLCVFIIRSQQVSAQLSGSTKKLRVLEVRYLPKGDNDVIYHPNTLTVQLQSKLKNGSVFHGYLGKNMNPSIEVQVISVINRYKPRPNVNGSWYATYKKILEEDNLCKKIHDNKIDQIWLWVDPRAGYDPNPGMEYVISSPMFQKNVQYATYASPAFCNGLDSFVIMGFDYSRSSVEGMHSFGHFLEGLLGNLQGIELFWYRFAGNSSVGFPLSERCGNVHFPPNGVKDYDYSNKTVVNTACEDWKPDGSGKKTAYSCARWGCTGDGYYQWWLQNMPNANNVLTFNRKKIPNWWDFIVDMDYSIPSYYKNAAFHMNREFLARNTIPIVSPRTEPTPNITATPNPTPTGLTIGPRCVGQCKGDLPGTSYPAGFSCIGMDNLCYLCGSNTSFSISKTSCLPTPTPTILVPTPSSPTTTPLPTSTTSVQQGCYGQCKGDTPKYYPEGHSCIGMDNLCYVCGTSKNFYVSSTACGVPTSTPTSTPTRTPTPTIIVANTSTPTVSQQWCNGQCKGDNLGTWYPNGHSCIGMDNLCYVCGSNRNFSVSQTACTSP